jgi:hypothetical protein
MHISAWMAHEENAPARITDDSIRLLQQALQDDSSPNVHAITDTCRQMVYSLLILRNGYQLTL